MHIDKTKSWTRTDAFMNGKENEPDENKIGKYKRLRKTLGKYDARYVFYNALAFTSMIEQFFNTPNADGLRIYLASYGREGSDSVPKDFGELLTLIFAPTTNEDNPVDTGKYYTIFPGQQKCQQLDKELAIAWVNNYRTIKLPDLNDTVDTKQDTKSIYYERRPIQDLAEEIKCQGASGIKAYFCTLPDDHKYKQQLMLDFTLTARIGNEDVDFNVQDRDGWEDRKKVGDLDTGSPCPPNHCNGQGIPTP
jgi:hypothetical protein